MEKKIVKAYNQMNLDGLAAVLDGASSTELQVKRKQEKLKL